MLFLTYGRRWEFLDSSSGRFSNRPFSYSKKECVPNDISLHFVEFSNTHKSDRSANANQSNLVYKDV